MNTSEMLQGLKELFELREQLRVLRAQVEVDIINCELKKADEFFASLKMAA